MLLEIELLKKEKKRKIIIIIIIIMIIIVIIMIKKYQKPNYIKYADQHRNASVMKVRVDLACSRRSHSGEQCEVKRIAKRLEQARRDPTTQSHYC